MKTFFKIIVLLILVAVIGVVGYLAYLGFVPGLSNLIGANKPRDLGVTYSQKDFDSFLAKTDISHEELTGSVSADKSVVFSGSKALKTEFSQAEASVRINNDKWAYMPVTNVQIRFNDDGTLEFSSNLIMNRLDGFIASIGGVGYSKADIEKGLGYLNLVKTNPPVYLKAKPVVKNNKVTVEVQSVQVGKIDVPIEKIDTNGFVASLAEKVFSRTPGFYANSFYVTGGKAVFDGTIPTKVQAQYSK